MKICFRILLANSILPFLCLASFAQDNGGSSSIPASLWESHPEGAALALTLETRMEKAERKSSLKIHLKNTSATDKAVIDDSIGSGFKIFTQDSAGKWQPLRDYDGAVTTTKFSMVVIKPGQTITYPLELSSAELSLIKSRPMQCRIMLSDPTTNQRPTIESSPRTLTETVATASAQ
jgi:hypothetical protein